MRSFRLITAAILLILFAACSKDSLTPKTTYPAPGTWAVRDTSFRAKASRWYRNYDSLDVITFGTDTSFSTNLSIEFYKKPTAPGTYKVVYSPDADDEVSIMEWQPVSHPSYSDDENPGTLYVTIENGKLTFKATKLRLKHDTFVTISHIDCSLNLTEL